MSCMFSIHTTVTSITVMVLGAVTCGTAYIHSLDVALMMNCRPTGFYARACGRIVCHECSTHKLQLNHLGYSEPVRVCDECYQRLGSGPGDALTEQDKVGCISSPALSEGGGEEENVSAMERSLWMLEHGHVLVLLSPLCTKCLFVLSIATHPCVLGAQNY